MAADHQWRHLICFKILLGGFRFLEMPWTEFLGIESDVTAVCKWGAESRLRIPATRRPKSQSKWNSLRQWNETNGRERIWSQRIWSERIRATTGGKAAAAGREWAVAPHPPSSGPAAAPPASMTSRPMSARPAAESRPLTVTSRPISARRRHRPRQCLLPGSNAVLGSVRLRLFLSPVAVEASIFNRKIYIELLL